MKKYKKRRATTLHQKENIAEWTQRRPNKWRDVHELKVSVMLKCQCSPN